MSLLSSVHFDSAKVHFGKSGGAIYSVGTNIASTAWNTARVVTNTALTTAAFDWAVGKLTTTHAAMSIASSMGAPIPVMAKTSVGTAFNMVSKYPGVTLAGSIVVSNIINPEPVVNTAKGLWGTLKNAVNAAYEAVIGVVEVVKSLYTLNTEVPSHDDDIKDFGYSEIEIEKINLLGDGDENGYVSIDAAPAA